MFTINYNYLTVKTRCDQVQNNHRVKQETPLVDVYPEPELTLKMTDRRVEGSRGLKF